METSNDNAVRLRDEVAKQYEVKPGKVRKFYSVKFGMVDLNTVTMAQAKALEQAGVLIKKNTKAPEKG